MVVVKGVGFVMKVIIEVGFKVIYKIIIMYMYIVYEIVNIIYNIF